MESIIAPLLKLIHDIPDELFLVLITILVIAIYKFIFIPWNENILSINEILIPVLFSSTVL